MLTSKQMYKRSQQLFVQSQKAFEAEMTIDPFLSAELGLKMLFTSVVHLERCAANLGLVLYCVANTATAVYKEDDAEAAFENGFAAMGHHFAAAAIDFGNIFFTLGAVLVRAMVTLVERCESNQNVLDRTITSVKAYAGKSILAPFTEQGSAYRDASALEFSLSSFSM